MNLQWTSSEDTTLHCNRTLCVDSCNTTSVSVLAGRFINLSMQPLLGGQAGRPSRPPLLRARASQLRYSVTRSCRRAAL